MKKLTKSGFSAIEVVIAVVAVVVVAGLGYFAYSNWSGGSDSETTQAAEAKEDGEITSDSEAEAVQADAGSWAVTPSISVDGMKVGAALCRLDSAKKYRVLWVKTGNKDLKTAPYSPAIYYYYKNSVGGYVRKAAPNGGFNWWLGSLQLYTFDIGDKDNYEGAVSVVYKNKEGAKLPWSNVKSC